MIQFLLFTYDSFSKELTKDLRAKIRRRLAVAVRDGELGRGLAHRKTAISSTIVELLIRTHLERISLNGAVDWTYTIRCCLGIILMCTFNCRVGELIRSKHYNGEEYIKWKDITIKVGPKGTVEDLRMRGELLFEKGYKYVRCTESYLVPC